MENKIGNSLKWSTAGEALSKIVSPVTNMILARVLAPKDFGILATVNMIITFVDLFTDSGFAKYIIQCDFLDEREADKYIDVAFWTNFYLSFFLWIIIFLFRFPIAALVGNKGHENVIVIASTQLILTSFSCIQTSLYRRNFDFKILFRARIVTAVIPLVVTVPLAVILRNYWSLVIGSIAVQLVNAVYLTIKSKWKPSLYYSFAKLHKMISFSIWSLAEAVAYWFITWFDIFIIGSAFSSYYLGIYKNSLNMVNSIMTLVKASIIPVLFSSLSRLKNNQKEFDDIYGSLQQTAAFIVFPMSIGIFIFRELVTTILFGSKWGEAANIIGAWALSSGLFVVFVNFFGEAFKAKGIPKILFIYETICLLIMIPICYYTKNIGFWPIVYTRASVVLVQVVLGLFFLKHYVHVSIKRQLKNLVPATICSLIMGCVATLLKPVSSTIVWQTLVILISVFVYFGSSYCLFKNVLQQMVKTIKGRHEGIQ